MSVQTVKLAGREFVIVPKADYLKLERSAGIAAKPVAKAAPKSARKTGRSEAQDKGDVAEALRRLKDAADPEIPYAEARKRLGLA